MASACDTQVKPDEPAKQAPRCPIAAKKHAQRVWSSSAPSKDRVMLPSTLLHTHEASMTGPAYQPNDEAILGISEICYLFCVSRSQLYEWRHRHDFPAARKTKHGFIGYRIGDLSAWISHNQSWLRNHQAPDVAA